MWGKIIGQPLPRVEGADKVSGALSYTADHYRPGTLWGKVLRSPYPHARIVNVDINRAKNLSGVKAIVTAADLDPRLIGAVRQDKPGLAPDRVRYVGEDIPAGRAGGPGPREETGPR